jgi:hypothetical protein
MNHAPIHRDPPLWVQLVSAVLFGALWLVLLAGFFSPAL